MVVSSWWFIIDQALERLEPTLRGVAVQLGVDNHCNQLFSSRYPLIVNDTPSATHQHLTCL
jgi:hypothetical protein